MCEGDVFSQWLGVTVVNAEGKEAGLRSVVV